MPQSRTWPERRRVFGAAWGMVVVLDPIAEAIGRMGQSPGREPGGVFVEGLVEVLRAEQGDMSVLECEGLLGLLRREPSLSHQVEGRGEPGPVGPALAMDEQRVGARTERIDQDE